MPEALSEQFALDQIMKLVHAEKRLLDAIDTLTEARSRWDELDGKADTIQAAARVQETIYDFCSALLIKAEVD